jgi:lipopolysaccharide assembly protein A
MPVQRPAWNRTGGPVLDPRATATPPEVPPPPEAAAPQHPRVPVRRTRTGAAWVGIVVGAAVLVLLIVFMLQNTVPVEVAFFGLTGTAPLALTLLIAGVGFAIVTLVVGSLRIGQLRRRIGRGDRGESQGGARR